MADAISEVDRLKLREADLVLALAQSRAKHAEALYALEIARIKHDYSLAEGETVNIDSGLIARKFAVVP